VHAPETLGTSDIRRHLLREQIKRLNDIPFQARTGARCSDSQKCSIPAR
jgi:hypothetical protein